MVLDIPVEFSTILPENKLIGKKHKTPPSEERKQQRRV